MNEDKETTAEAPKSGRRLKLILIIALPLLLVVGGGGAAYVMGMVPGMARGDGAAEAEPTPEDPRGIVFVDLPDMLVNLNAGGHRLRYLKIAAALEIRGEHQADLVRQFVPRILDSFQLYLRAVRPEELEGAEGVYRIKEALLARTNDAVHPAQVHDVLIRELLVQ
ncbi:MAG TPA: flagellar basal body-associated FliL family protein [Geminicoccaceae bacterium]|jgi:flagellar protein FliL|nr:flagellar basal body-associated FliL family protein [Geminicoccaceae bacterium]